MPDLRLSGLLLVLNLLLSCSSTPKPSYEYEQQDQQLVQCIEQCDIERKQCYGVLARVFQRCVARNLGSNLEQQRCLEREQSRAVARLDIQQSGIDLKNCEQLYDLCFIACGGRIVLPEQTTGSDTEIVQ